MYHMLTSSASCIEVVNLRMLSFYGETVDLTTVTPSEQPTNFECITIILQCVSSKIWALN